jgi:hypothetical protein
MRLLHGLEIVIRDDGLRVKNGALPVQEEYSEVAHELTASPQGDADIRQSICSASRRPCSLAIARLSGSPPSSWLCVFRKAMTASFVARFCQAQRIKSF